MQEIPSKTKELPKLAIEATNHIANLCQNYEEQITKLKAENEFFNNFSPAEALLDYPADNPDTTYWADFKPEHLESYPSIYDRDRNKPDFIKRGWTIEKCQKLLEEGERISLQNKEIISRNQNKYEKILALFKRLGLPETKRVKDDKSRARYTKYIDVATNWPNELGGIFPRYNQWSSLKASLEQAIKHIKQYELSKQQHLDKQKQLQEAEKNKNKEIISLAELNGKYKLNIEPDALDKQEVLSKLIEQNKYLCLAHFLLANRNDWSDGHDLAECGLNFFDSKSAEVNKGINDDEISSDIHSCINNWDGDGRTFRDTKWNYDVLFGIVKEQNADLYADYCKLAGLN